MYLNKLLKSRLPRKHDKNNITPTIEASGKNSIVNTNLLSFLYEQILQITLNFLTI